MLVTCHRRESWGAGLISIADALRRLARENVAKIDLILHPNPAVAAQMRLLLGGEPGVRLHNPCSHSDLVRRMLNSELVLSDSGGIQEEAAALGIPLLVLRERTERPEAIATGRLTLAGLNADAIVDAVRTALSRDVSHSSWCPYGDGNAAPRIAAIILEWLTERRLDRAPLHNMDRTESSGEKRLAT
jgi:UDP-N-acetylglucosamine 2-epimerase (non-hydrolysing)